MRLYSFLVFLLLLAIPTFACADSSSSGYISEQDGISINWGSGLISSSSEILPMQDTIDPQRTKALAVRQSGIKARKALLDSILNLRLNSKDIVYDAFKDEMKGSALLRGFVQNSLLSTQDTADGMVKVIASTHIRGELSSIIIPATLPFLSGIPPTLSDSRENDNSLNSNGEEAVAVSASSYTGIVVDARGMDIAPVLLPVIYDGKGIGVYGPFVVSREAVLKNGLVAFVTDTPFSRLRERVGNTPLVVKPVSTHGTVRGNVILSLADAARARSVLKRKSVTDNCSVVIMMDAPKVEVVTPDVVIGGAVSAGSVQGGQGSSVNDSGLQEDSIVDEGTSPASQQ
ncbi:hypothetical protein [Maridesulfovibrio frigidus]|uniref:hypothetical protein n=1 Tax=Maridesulfovibrio frigidus TaxID=340956 RepID=UPI000AA11699|nr:hypothetical protein [Maridesulfovibrio frigidus]